MGLQALLYADDRALASYLGGAALMVPGLARARCESLRLREPPASCLPRALLFADDAPLLPAPRDPTITARLTPARYDRRRSVLVLEPQGAPALQVAVESDGPPGVRELVRRLRPVPWEAAPTRVELLYAVRPGPAFAQLVSEHLELGVDRLRYASTRTAELGEQLLLEVRTPSWFLLERWLGAPGEPVRPFRRLFGPLGPRRVWVEWGCTHPLESWIADPPGEREMLLVDREGRHLLLPGDALKDVGEALLLDPTLFPCQALTPAGEPEPIRIALRLEDRATPRDPELWLVPLEERQRLEQLLAQTPEDELRNLLVACLEPEGGAGRLFAVREVLSGRAPRLLPLGPRAYAPHPGLPNLLLPCGQHLVPPLSQDRYARAFGLRPGELCLVEAAEAAGAGLRLRRLPERAFQPLARVVEFVVDAEAERLSEVLLRAPFDLGPFAGEDLLAQGEARAARPRPQRAAAPAPEPAEPRAAEKAPQRGLLGRLKGLFAGPELAPAPTAAVAAGSDPRREAQARLERELALGEATPRAWWELAGLLLGEEQVEEGLRAAEHALWSLPVGDAAPVLSALGERLGPVRAGHAPEDTAELWRRALAFCARAQALGATGDVEAFRSATEAVYAHLHEEEARLRKKTRWLLWGLVLRETRDAIEQERQREDVLADLVLRGVEDREVPPFVRRALLDHYGLKAATGAGASEAVGFLEAAQRFAAGLHHPALRAEALAHVAWALAELGQPERAREVAQLAEHHAGESPPGLPPHPTHRARALARVGAVLERTGGRDQGQRQLERSLQTVLRLLGEAQVESDAQQAFAAWLQALADARGGGVRAQDPLLERALEGLAARVPEHQALILSTAVPALQRLGAGARALELSRRLLEARLSSLHLEHVIRALEGLGEGAGLRAPDAQRVLELLLAAPQDIDEFSVDMFLAALRALPGNPLETVDRLRATLQAGGHDYAARLLRLAGLRRLAEQRERRLGPDLLARALEDAWSQGAVARPQGGGLQGGGSPPGSERMRLVVRLAAQVPEFGLRERGLSLLSQIKQRAEQETHPFTRNELLMSVALAVSKLGDSRSSFELVEQVAARALETFQGSEPSWNNPTWLLFETLEACADGAAELGDARRGLPLVQRIAAAARAALEARRTPAHGLAAAYFYCRALLRCGRAALSLGDQAAAGAIFAQGFEGLRQLRGQDLVDVLEEAVQTAGQLEGHHRYALARRVLETAQGATESRDLMEKFAVRLTSGFARDMVQGESAFTAALKRWKGREERAIRDRVATEQLP